MIINRYLDLREDVESCHWISVHPPIRIFWWLTVRIHIKLRNSDTAKPLPKGYGD